MAKKRSPLASLLVLALLFAAVWLYFTPYLALHRLQAAAKSGDTEAMNELVDFPSLRESVKQDITGVVENGISHSHNPLAVFGGLLLGRVSAPLVDAVLTPQGIAALTEGHRPGLHNANGDTADQPSVRIKGVDVKRGYEGLDLFVVHFVDRNSGHEKMALLMRRDGIARWRLSGVRLPSASTSSGDGDAQP
jgi:hypothetical protein